MASTTIASATTAPPLSQNDAIRQKPQAAHQLNLQKQPQTHDVTADFKYYKDPGDGSRPEPVYVAKRETEFPSEIISHVVHDIRGQVDQFTLENKGFQIYNHISKEKAFVSDNEIKRVYYPEIEDILKSVTGASEIFIFDHVVRRQPQENAGPKKPAAVRGPVQHVHVDQSYKGGPMRVKHQLPDDSPRLLKGRVQIINAWRPIKTIRKDPFGVADAASVLESDLVPQELHFPDHIGESWNVKANQKHRWYYLHEQTPEEVLLFKVFDSKNSGQARRVPHSAFVDQEAEHEISRESIEVRAIVFHPVDSE